MTSFTADTYQNEYLPEGASEVNAIVTITASGTGGRATDSAPAAESAEIIIIDRSGSMDRPSTKIAAARRATQAAIDCLRDGVWFAVIFGYERAEVLYPTTPGMVRADATTRAEAKRAVAQLDTAGQTAIGEWLLLAKRLFESCPAPIRHAILLTDGRIEGETMEHFHRALAEVSGQFECDCRGIGTDWVVSELRQVAQSLMGIVPDPDRLEAEFRLLMEHSMTKTVSDVALRLWTPQGATVKFVKQVSPTIDDLSGRRVEVNALTGDYPTGAWGDESRDYHVCVQVRAGAVGDEMLAGRLSLVVDGQVESQALVKALWTDDTGLSTRLNKQVAHYTGQAELAAAIQDGLEARKQGDQATATIKLGRAVQLAQETGNEATTKLLTKVVDIDDGATGTVRLKRVVDDADEMALDTRSTKTTRVRPT